MLRLDPCEQLNLDEQDSKIINSNLTSPKTILELPTKIYVDSLHEISRNGRDLSLVFNDQGTDVDRKKLTKLNSVSVNKVPSSDGELANKKAMNDELDENIVLRFDKTLKNYLKVSVGTDTYHLTK